MARTPIYAGIGSRKTPHELLEIMRQIGKQLAQDGWILRSGFADGADNAFAAGAEHAAGHMEIFIPWPGFNNAPGDHEDVIVPSFTDEMERIAREHHPAWGICPPGVRRLHMRNVCQILGGDLKTPADLVICWTPNGAGQGGTGQAIRIALTHKIPVFDLALGQKTFDELCEYTEQVEKNCK
ncbi:hypothetical protein [Caballeronia sp. LZ034LL]|uniref:hypothetical protein n=1 Tax=Caballeronia sp. LZ034LL TaxID=3038567 RepID=UPI00285FA89F|nr:hypothetical protein [Caballeronia sp. LZ034LL]MDR5839341.1 hypothetical protein [Caballeronia sp. LZ034LL]